MKFHAFVKAERQIVEPRPARIESFEYVLTQKPVMGAEDFSFMLNQKPGAYIWLGAGLESENLHSPHFDFNDEILPIGASFWVRLAESKLAQT